MFFADFQFSWNEKKNPTSFISVSIIWTSFHKISFRSSVSLQQQRQKVQFFHRCVKKHHHHVWANILTTSDDFMWESRENLEWLQRLSAGIFRPPLLVSFSLKSCDYERAISSRVLARTSGFLPRNMWQERESLPGDVSTEQALNLADPPTARTHCATLHM